MTVMNVLIGVAIALFACAAVAALYRVIRGPSLLDRVIAMDVLLATVMCALGADMAIGRHANSLPILIVLAAFAFVGSVSVARFMGKQDDT